MLTEKGGRPETMLTAVPLGVMAGLWDGGMGSGAVAEDRGELGGSQAPKDPHGRGSVSPAREATIGRDVDVFILGL